MLKLIMATMETKLRDEMTPVFSAPTVEEPSSRYSHRSIETLVVVLAAITIIAVIAGTVARLCGGRHLGASGDNDIEGWVESKCRTCIDAGVAPSAGPPPPPEDQSKPPAQEVKK
ncbi:uncharacterized protein LOC110811293 [Carica papaya]|uniref:uncharacterized protein LOC110811293 n=1 Tax=Carica papaya TaxID=3649 RepID=UPI000B8D191B|nr:uncharacterized protein LOC110811293 [Carica papaya]